MDDRPTVQPLGALMGVVLLVGAALSVAPVDSRRLPADAPTPGSDGDDGADDFNGTVEDNDDEDGAFDEDDEPDIDD